MLATKGEIKMKRTVLLGMLATQALTVLAQVIATNEPQPGTREYYSKYIEGRYCYQNGGMVPAPFLAPPVAGATPGAIRPVIRPTTAPAPQPLRGTIVQVAGTNEVIIRTITRMPSGAEKPGYAVLWLHALDGISVEQEIVTNVVQDGSYRCVLASGVTNILGGYRVPENPSTITFDEYLEVFKRDSQVAPIGHVLSVERISDRSRASYAERLRQRREAMHQRTAASTNAPHLTGEEQRKFLEQYQMDIIRAGGAKGPPLPIQLTPEMDAQLVKEGVLPPIEDVQKGKANQASEAVSAEAAPQAQR